MMNIGVFGKSDFREHLQPDQHPHRSVRDRSVSGAVGHEHGRLQHDRQGRGATFRQSPRGSRRTTSSRCSRPRRRQLGRRQRRPLRDADRRTGTRQCCAHWAAAESTLRPSTTPMRGVRRTATRHSRARQRCRACFCSTTPARARRFRPEAPAEARRAGLAVAQHPCPVRAVAQLPARAAAQVPPRAVVRPPAARPPARQRQFVRWFDVDAPIVAITTITITGSIFAAHDGATGTPPAIVPTSTTSTATVIRAPQRMPLPPPRISRLM